MSETAGPSDIGTLIALGILGGIVFIDLMTEKTKEHLVGREKALKAPQYGLPPCIVDEIHRQFQAVKKELRREIQEALHSSAVNGWTDEEKAMPYQAGEAVVEKAMMDFTVMPTAEDLSIIYRTASLAMNDKLVAISETKRGGAILVDDPKTTTHPAQTVAPRGTSDISKLVAETEPSTD
jgi:hypothetical protein